MKKKRKRGQVIMEYILTILAIVGMVMAAYIAIRHRLYGPMLEIKAKIQANSGSGGQPAESYYENTQYQVK